MKLRQEPAQEAQSQLRSLPALPDGVRKPDPATYVDMGLHSGGRTIPRSPASDPALHVIRYYPSFFGNEWGIAARCEECPGGWSVWVKAGQPRSKLVELEKMHSGPLED